MTPPPQARRRPITCPNCGDTRTLAAFPNAHLRCPKCRTQYTAPPLEATVGATAAPTADAGDPTHPPASEARGAGGPDPTAGTLSPKIVRPSSVAIRPTTPPPAGTTPTAPPLEADGEADGETDPAPHVSMGSDEAEAPPSAAPASPPASRRYGRHRRPLTRRRTQ